jgi:acetolactate synthase-1/2/3 large subunit
MEVIRDCDVILGIGLDPNELDRDWPDKERAVWLLTSPNVGQTHLPANTWRGNLQIGLAQLTRLLAGGNPNHAHRAEQIRQRVRSRLEAGIPENPRGMSPLQALDTLASLWPSADPVCCDVGAHKLLIGQQWPARIPNRFFMSNGLSSMGYGLAAPIALSLASGGSPVLSVVGDGGLMMLMGELETAVRAGARVLYVVFCDGSLALIESAQRRREYPLYGMRFAVPDIARIGAAFGLPSWQVEDQAGLRNAVEGFKNLTGPALVSITVDPREYDVQAS